MAQDSPILLVPEKVSISTGGDKDCVGATILGFTCPGMPINANSAPVYMIDHKDCAIPGYYILTVSSHNLLHEMRPIAVGFVSSKSESVCTMFLAGLKRLITRTPTEVIIDNAKELQNASKKVFPNAINRDCAWHLRNNAFSRRVKRDGATKQIGLYSIVGTDDSLPDDWQWTRAHVKACLQIVTEMPSYETYVGAYHAMRQRWLDSADDPENPCA
eukprot:Hpha_TRINITY_DN16474_c1_g1::TRINITY_DN16474_c1_g1_i2::g.160318::m.160318